MAGKRLQAPPLKPAAEKRSVIRWMRLHATEYDVATQLVEGANAALDLPKEWLDDDAHWIWDEAALLVQ